MADDQKPEEKTKKTVPALAPTAEGIAVHAAAVDQMQWDRERGVFRDPSTVMKAALTYCRLLGSRLYDEERKRTTLEGRVAEFEKRIANLELFEQTIKAQAADAAKQIEAMMAAEQAAANNGQTAPDQAVVKPEAPVLEIKPAMKKPPKSDAGGQGGAA